MDKLTAPLEPFKEREIEIITLMAEGRSNKEISETLFLSKETVRWYNKQIYSKLGTSRRVEAVSLARQFGLISSDKTATSPQTIRQKLPVTTGPFIGRDAEVNEIATLLDKPEVRLLSLVAAGGMGKSRLSLELGHQIKHKFEHGAAFIDLTSVKDPSAIAKAALVSLGLNENGRLDSKEMLLNYCREKSLLLIFDNFEDVLAGASLLSDILEAAPNVSILVTTRERLNLRVETVYVLHPVMRSGSKLFEEVALIMHPNLDFDDGEREEMERIVQAVGGLPLALILAASWLDTLSISEIVAEIEGNLDFLSSEMGDMPARQQSIHAVIDPTWQRLTPKEQQAFLYTAVFRAGFTRDAFQKVTGASMRTIQTLLRRSLITQGNGRRYDLHPLIRQYAYEKLEAKQLLADAMQAHLTAFVTISAKHSGQMYSGRYLDSINSLAAEQENCQAALDWSLAGNRPEDGIAMLLNLANFWQIRSQSKTAVSYFKKALTFKQSAMLYLWLGRFQFRLERNDEVIGLVETAVSLAEEANDIDTLGICYYVLGYMVEHQDRAKATLFLEKSLEIAKRKENLELTAFCLTSLGILDGENNQWTKALQKDEQAIAIFEKRGDLRGISMVSYNMSLIHNRLGNRQKARELCEQSLRTKRQIGDKAGAARRLGVLAEWDFADEENERAQKYLAESIAISEELGEQKRLHYALCIQGFMMTVTGQYRQANAALERALAIVTQHQSPRDTAWTYSNLGLLHLVQGNVSEAAPHVTNALKAVHQTDFISWEAMTAYANLLWYQQKFESCAFITATLSLALEQNDNVRATSLSNQYSLRPLIHRVKIKLGTKGWQTVQEKAAETTIAQLFKEIMTQLNIVEI